MPQNNSRPAGNGTNLGQLGFRQGQGPRHGLSIPQEKSKDARGTLLRIWGYLKRQRRSLWIVVLSTAFTSGAALLGPYLIGKAIDNYVVPHKSRGFLLMCLILLAVYALGALFTWLQQYIASSLSQHTVRDMRQDLFEKYQQLPIRFFDRKTHGELMSRATNDIENVSNTLNQTMVQLVSSILMLVGSIIMMLTLSLWMTLVTVLIIPVITFITKSITKYTRRYFSGQQKELGEVNGYIQETMSGLKVIKTFGHEAKTIQAFHEKNDRLRDVGVKAQMLSGSMGPIMNATRNLSFVMIAAAGSIFAYDHMITIGIIVSFLNYSNLFSQPINQLANQYNMLQSAVAGAERVFEILDLEPESQDGASGTSEKIKGEVEFEHVSFSYTPGVSVLKNLTLHARPGQMIALVGPTGAGKTTIINLLTRFYDFQSGRILIDGKDIREFNKFDLRRQIGIVLQDAYVFAGTIRDNIRYGRLEATDEEVERAAKLANADSFIRKLPNGYNTYLQAEGSNISQGQRQLLTIARAMLADPAILILDEATSNVDTRTEFHIQAAMKSLMKGRTSFVIAHRLSTIREADMILVINHGEIIEKGSHQELLEQNGFYANLYQTQFA